MQYDYQEIEKKWQKKWADEQTFKADNQSEKPKYYVLDMFPYPSGAGLHVGHPLGYIASDIYARFKRHKGFNVLHPIGYDSFGLPAEQYAIQTGQHPATTTKVNIEGGVDKQGNHITGYENQLKKIGLSFDWSREVRTSDPSYYKWSQWIFIQLFNSYYCNDCQKARPIQELIEAFEKEGNATINATTSQSEIFTADQWKSFSEKEQSDILLNYRLTYLAEAEVNWCPALGTVLANDEVINGVSERGGHPVVRKKMTQWMMRITAYAERLLQGLDNNIEWSEAIKESQRNWIGKSQGASIKFTVRNSQFSIEVFTTRPDTIFGVSFMTLAPEHPLVQEITTDEYKEAVQNYIAETAKRSERERMADVKTISGQFTGAYVVHPFTGEDIPVWIGDYVLAGYGTGAVMAVPAGDERDYAFAKHFNIPIHNIFEGVDISEEAFTDKQSAVALTNSDFLNGLTVKEATQKIINALEEKEIGQGKINYRLRDAVFSRQRYWGEPVPIYFKQGIPYAIPTECLPLELPEVEKYLPTETGEPPLGRAENWAWNEKENKIVAVELIDEETVFPIELNTMPGWAGSSWYWMRYMDAQNNDAFASQQALDYWQDVNLYIGGSEHATGHLLYSRFWNKFLKDVGFAPTEEPFKKLVNQGMILGNSAFVYRLGIISEKFPSPNNEMLTNIYISKGKLDGIKKGNIYFLDELKKINMQYDKYKYQVFHPKEYPIHIDLSLINEANNELDIEKFRNWREEYQNAEFILEDGKYIVGREVEKMSKSKYNVLNPDDICEEYGADTLRMYEMFLGPIEQAKPWNTQGLSGVFGFLRKFWRLYHTETAFEVSEEEPTKQEYKVLHQTIKKVTEDIENFSFNTSIATFMIAVNELTKLKTNKRAILEPLAVLVSPFAPHIAEELWEKLGHSTSIEYAEYPVVEEKYLVEDAKEYPVSFNGKVRYKIELATDLTKEQIETIVMADERTQKQLDGRTPKQVIIVPGRIINIVG